MKNLPPHKRIDYLIDYLKHFKTDKDYDLYYDAYELYYNKYHNTFRWTFKTFIRNECFERDGYLNIVKINRRKKQIEEIFGVIE
jgi:hypothetical protein